MKLRLLLVVVLQVLLVSGCSIIRSVTSSNGSCEQPEFVDRVNDNTEYWAQARSCTIVSTADWKIYAVAPTYPRSARNERIEGYVQVNFFITPEGRVANPKVISSEPSEVFNEAALTAIKLWYFEPETGIKKTENTEFKQKIVFSLP